MNEIQDEFKKILEYSIRRGNEDTVTVKEFVNDLADQLRKMMEKMKHIDHV